ncbi:MAG: sugar ABC transporter substrate-binding protein [bacterium]|nr:sugar ABC transporter substrate-binding protein [bacterium]
MKRTMILFFVAIFMFSVAAVPTFAEEKQLTVGYVVPYEIGWFAYFIQGFELVAEKHGVKTIRVFNNYEPEREIKAVQDLITTGVDAINITSPSPDSAQYACQLANEANIPIQVTDSHAAPGPGKPFADVDFEWSKIYISIVDSLRKEVSGPINLVSIQGFAGSGPVELGIQGMKEGIEQDAEIELASLQYADYRIDKAMSITQDLVQSGLDFNTIIGSCQEITEGAIQALMSENRDLNDVNIVTVNGGPMDVENFQKGYIDYGLSLSPGVEGMICAENLIAYLKGEPYQENPRVPFTWVNRDTWEADLIPWDVDESWMPVVEEFVKTGEFKPELVAK